MLSGPTLRGNLPAKRAIEGVRKTILVASGKGGVGKSSVSASLAQSFSKLGLKTGLLDADLYGPSIPRLMGIQAGTKLRTEVIDGHSKFIPVESSGVKCVSMGLLVDEAAPIVWRGLMVMKAIEQLLFQVAWSPLDVLVVDMPPGTGDTQLTISQQTFIDGAVIVTTPQELALSDARRAVAMFQKVNIPILGYVENMSGFSCPNCKTCSPIFPVGKKLESVDKLASFPLDPTFAQASDSGNLQSSPAEIQRTFTDMAQSLILKLGI